jgi:hypothetical protein
MVLNHNYNLICGVSISTWIVSPTGEYLIALWRMLASAGEGEFDRGIFAARSSPFDLQTERFLFEQHFEDAGGFAYGSHDGLELNVSGIST